MGANLNVYSICSCYQPKKVHRFYLICVWRVTKKNLRIEQHQICNEYSAPWRKTQVINVNFCLISKVVSQLRSSMSNVV